MIEDSPKTVWFPSDWPLAYSLFLRADRPEIRNSDSFRVIEGIALHWSALINGTQLPPCPSFSDPYAKNLYFSGLRFLSPSLDAYRNRAHANKERAEQKSISSQSASIPQPIGSQSAPMADRQTESLKDRSTDRQTETRLQVFTEFEKLTDKPNNWKARLESYCQQLPADLLLYAESDAQRLGKQAFPYVEKIVLRYIREGYRSLDEVTRSSKPVRQNPALNYDQRSYANEAHPMPEWLQKQLEAEQAAAGDQQQPEETDEPEADEATDPADKP